ncbi:MAG: NAD(+)/NADH kinase [Coriobacteriales bacterium]|jgi:diacylglycerol kinase family enzyme|nr:NAD(+)/NADH kinase [Coriobacteriales bacterium]
MKVLIVNNLTSGLHDGAIFEFMRKFVQDGDEIVIRNTDGNTLIARLVADAAKFDLVVAAGGDGTIASVCYELRNTQIPILPYPAGTGNLLATNLNQPDEPYAIAAMARQPLLLDYDLGEIDFTLDGQTATRGFAIIAGAGYDATIMEGADRLKELMGPGAYVAAAVANPGPRLAHFRLTLDEGVVESDGIAALVLNFGKIFPDISITHDNNARDGLLEVAIVKTHNAVELLPAIFAAFLDRTGGFPSRMDAIETYHARSVLIESDPPLNIQYDGEAPGATTPLAARILPAATRLVVTPEEFELRQQD